MLSASSAKPGSRDASGDGSVACAGGCGERNDVRDEGRSGVVGREGGLEVREARWERLLVDILRKPVKGWTA